jgi:hypothetical protein
MIEQKPLHCFEVAFCFISKNSATKQIHHCLVIPIPTIKKSNDYF